MRTRSKKRVRILRNRTIDLDDYDCLVDNPTIRRRQREENNLPEDNLPPVLYENPPVDNNNRDLPNDNNLPHEDNLPVDSVSISISGNNGDSGDEDNQPPQEIIISHLSNVNEDQENVDERDVRPLDDEGSEENIDRPGDHLGLFGSLDSSLGRVLEGNNFRPN